MAHFCVGLDKSVWNALVIRGEIVFGPITSCVRIGAGHAALRLLGRSHGEILHGPTRGGHIVGLLVHHVVAVEEQEKDAPSPLLSHWLGQWCLLQIRKNEEISPLSCASLAYVLDEGNRPRPREKDNLNLKKR